MEPEKQGERKEKAVKETNERQRGGRKARSQAKGGVCAEERHTRDSAQGLRAVTDTSPFHSATGTSQEFQEGMGQMAKDQAFN